YNKDNKQPIGLLKDITSLIENKYDKKFILSGISKLCAFYLSNQFKLEKEYRVLFSCSSGCNINILNDGQNKYIEIPLGVMSSIGYKIEVIEIQTNEILNVPSQYKPLLKRWV
ncbi:hypothetical protein, partial [Aliivibrio salmonicida]|uniref:hypothetical protein n=1 Tax=Aliivibrio salmonicida TaxID=40269 RepID=UPI003D11E674